MSQVYKPGTLKSHRADCNGGTLSLYIGFWCNGNTAVSKTVRCGFESYGTCHLSGCSSVGRVLVLGTRCREFESHHSDHGELAQLGEREFCKLEVEGSIPLFSTIF